MCVRRAVLQFTRLSANAFAPVRASKHAAGVDLRSAADVTIAAAGRALIPTDLAVKLPPNCYGRVAPRSGLALKHHISVGAGVIDPDYRGPIGVLLFNHSSERFQVKKGDRVAQLICEVFCHPVLEEVDSLDETERGQGGFGSTGNK